MTDKQMAILRRKFPNAPESFFSRQVQDAFKGVKVSKVVGENSGHELIKILPPTLVSTITIQITIAGQIMGGKNNMIVTRTGLHFPRPAWAKWRNEKVAEVAAQLPANWTPIAVPVNARLEYFAGDKRRRDQPAVIDSIFHIIEKAGVVVDDSLVWISESSRGYSKDFPCAKITFL